MADMFGQPSAEFRTRLRLAEAVIAEAPPYPEGCYSGRGIVTCAGGARYFPSAWVLINMLRHLGCSLPVELWYLGRHELTEEMAELVRPLGVTCVDAHEVRQRHPARILNGWEVKPYSIIHSRFEEVLFLDADNIPVVNPEFLFDAPQYRESGAVFWPDYGRLSRHRAIWEVCGVPYRDEPEFESGQILVHKRRCWQALQLAMHYNAYSDFYYQHAYGDKETFHMAWRRLGQEYAMPQHPVRSLARCVMCQHGFEGRRLFQHRNLAKWQRDPVRNPRIDGFLHEDKCIEFLRELAGKWSGEEPPLEPGTEREKEAFQDVVNTERFVYHRVGYDSRVMQFLPDQAIGEGAAAMERTWRVEEKADGTVALGLFGDAGLICDLTKGADGVWRGRWNRFEMMLIELVPTVKAREATPGGALARPEADQKPTGDGALDGEKQVAPADLTIQALVPERLRVCILTVEREPPYIHTTLASLFLSGPAVHWLGAIDILVDSNDTNLLWEYRHHRKLNVHYLTDDEWREERRRSIRARFCYNYWRALSLPTEGYDGFLILEDDGILRDDFTDKLAQSVQEIGTQHGIRRYILAIASNHRLVDDASLYRGKYYISYPAHQFYGSSGVYWPASMIAEARECFWEDGVARAALPGDLLIGQLGARHNCLYKTAWDLVDHIGEVSTGLGGRDRHATFYEPWAPLEPPG